MRSVIFSKLCITVFTVILYFKCTNAVDIDNHQETPDLRYFSNGSYLQQNLHRYTRQNTPRCRIPINPPHTTYKFISKTQTNLSAAGDYAENYNILQIICENEFSINPIAEKNSICINGKWTPPLTNCLRACPLLNSIDSTNVKCNWNDHRGNQIPLPNCFKPVEGTTAFLSCNSWHEEHNIKRNPFRVCNQGKWNHHISECYPTAHCFTEYNRKKKSAENYLIAAGKYYRNYDDERDKFAQYAKILEIHVPPRYKGIINLQGFDIAIIILTNPLEITPSVQPICIELNEQSKSFNLSLIKYGTVTGWGYTKSGRELSEVLKEIVIPYIPYEKCFQTVPLNFRRYITHDKICGGYINSSAGVCGGDSGGSYIFQKIDSDRHFVKGIVSVSPATIEGVCDPNQYGVYTFVDEHIDFIRLHLTNNLLHQSLDCKQDGCNEEPPSDEDCNSNNDFTCKNSKIHCIMPNLPLDGEYQLGGNNTYIPGGYAQINTSLIRFCGAVLNSLVDKSIIYNCADNGEWDPPLETLETCADKPGYCRVKDSFYIKEDTSIPAPIGVRHCGTTKCVDAKTNSLLFLICPARSSPGCSYTPHDYTKLYPACCPMEVCYY